VLAFVGLNGAGKSALLHTLQVGLHSLPGVVRLVTWSIPAISKWCLRPYALLGLSLLGVGFVTRTITLAFITCVFAKMFFGKITLWSCEECQPYVQQHDAVGKPPRPGGTPPARGSGGAGGDEGGVGDGVSGFAGFTLEVGALYTRLFECSCPQRF
jgi:hypothetical protein